MKIEYRVLWEELIAGERFLFSGEVGTFKQTQKESDWKRNGLSNFKVHIEARTASTKPWPHPWDETSIRPGEYYETSGN